MAITHVGTKTEHDLVHAATILIGMIVGVGMYGVPFVVQKSGLGVGIALIVILTCFVTGIHLLYAKIIQSSPTPHRLPGYAGLYGGTHFKKITLIVNCLSFYGALTAYAIAGGIFLQLVLGDLMPIPLIAWQFIFYALHVVAVVTGMRTVSFLEFWLSLFMIGVLLYIFGISVPQWNSTYFTVVQDWRDVFAPFGIILFSLGGAAAIPEMRDFLKTKKKLLPPAIILGTVIPAALIIMLVIAVVGTTGPSTSEDSLRGLQVVLGDSVAVLGGVLGLVAVSTSFLVMGTNLFRLFQLDYGQNLSRAAMLALTPPVAFFLLARGSFIAVLDVTGAVFGSLEGMIMALVYLCMRKRKGLPLSGYDGVAATIIVVFGIMLGLSLKRILGA